MTRTNSSPELEGVRALLERRAPQHARRFTLACRPDDGPETFEVSASGGTVSVSGSSISAVTAAINWYCTQVCRTSLFWDEETLLLPDELPDIAAVRHTARFGLRYAFNFCTFAYSTAFWDWPRWNQEIDWLALRSINLPLAVTGFEAPWSAVLRASGLSDTRIREYLGGPVYLPFNWMSCLDTFAGPLPAGWVEQRRHLQQRILDRQRSLGMRPILPAFNGHVPTELAGPDSTILRWHEFTTKVLDPLDPRFRELGSAFLAEQIDSYGTDHLYAADPFIEMLPAAGDPEYLQQVARAVLDSMLAVDPQAVWVLQGWMFSHQPAFWTRERIAAFLSAIPDEHVIVCDLWCDQEPMWEKTQAFHGKPWLWCMLHNFGDQPGLHGKLPRLAADLVALRDNTAVGGLTGIGLTMEARGRDPVVYEYLLDQIWHETPDEPGTWIGDYVARRYRHPTPPAREAWQLLLDSAYAAHDEPGPPRSTVVQRPVGSHEWESNTRATEPYYPVSVLARAWDLLLEAVRPPAAPDARLDRDVVDVGLQLLALLAGEGKAGMVAAYTARDLTQFDHAAQRFTALLNAVDALAATVETYRFETWLQEALRWARDAGGHAVLAGNLRRLVTTWSVPGTRLSDYSGRHWAGLVRGFHLPRWRIWVDAHRDAIASGAAVDERAIDQDITHFEEAWLNGEVAVPSPDDTASPRSVAARLRAEFDDLLATASRGPSAPAP